MGGYLERYKNTPKPVRAALWITVCNFIVRGISFLVAPIVTRLLPTEEYGALAVFNSYNTIVLILATWEIQQGAYTRGLFRFKSDEHVFTIATQCVVNLLTTAVFLFALIFHDWIETVVGIPHTLLFPMYIYLLFFPAYTMWMTRKRIVYDYRPVCALTLLYALLHTFIPMAAVVLVERTAEVSFCTSMICAACLCLFLWLPHARYYKLTMHRDETICYWRYLITYEAPLIIHSLSYFALNQSDRIMIGRMVGNESAALYSLAYTLSLAVSMLQSSVEQVLGPWRYEKLEHHDYKSFCRVTNVTLALFGGISLIYMIVAPEVLLIFPTAYREAMWCIPPVAASVFFTFLYSTFVGVESYLEKTKYIMYVSVFCSLINIVLNYVLIPFFGYVACAYTTLISYILFSVGHYLFMRRALKESGITESVVDIKTIFRLALIFLVISAFVLTVYNNILARYGLLLIVAAGAFIYRRRIAEIMKVLRKEPSNKVTPS